MCVSQVDLAFDHMPEASALAPDDYRQPTQTGTSGGLTKIETLPGGSFASNIS